MGHWKRGTAAAVLLVVGWLLGTATARAQTVDEIVSRGTINIGVLVDLPPYGLLNDKQEPDGYDIEVARLLASYMGVKLNLVPLTSPNRIPFLVTNKVDLIVATFGITPERAKQVMFSIPYGAIENVVFAAKDRDIKSLDDLKGLRVGVPRGTVQDVILTKRFGNAIKISRFDDDPSTYQALIAGQVDAVAETGLTGDEFYAKNPGRQYRAQVHPAAAAERNHHAGQPVQPAPVGQHIRLLHEEQWGAGRAVAEMVPPAAAQPADLLAGHRRFGPATRPR